MLEHRTEGLRPSVSLPAFEHHTGMRLSVMDLDSYKPDYDQAAGDKLLAEADSCVMQSVSGSSPMAQVQYVTGRGGCGELPPDFILGCLKYIAHAVAHAGDGDNQLGGSPISPLAISYGFYSDPATASGAREIWLPLRTDIH